MAGGSHEIIVTATKTSQAASKVPQALSVFSGDTRKEKGVVFSIDGVPVGRPQLMGLGLLRSGAHRMLRGPQGTLYGKSSTGGAINVITAKHEYAASAFAEIGNYNTRRFEGMVNLPITDSLAVRTAIASNSREGFIKPVHGNFSGGQPQAPLGAENNWAARLAGKYDFGNNGSFVLTGTFGYVGGADGSNSIIYSRVTQFKGANYYHEFNNENDLNWLTSNTPACIASAAQPVAATPTRRSSVLPPTRPKAFSGRPAFTPPTSSS